MTGCIDKEERAEKFYASALELRDEGDTSRAIIELRNALKNNKFHREARELYGELLLQEDDIPRAYAQFNILSEQHPNDAEIRRRLAEIALDTNSWDEVERHGQKALELEPDNLRGQALGVILAYFEAKKGDDMLAAAGQVEEARALLEKDPDLDTALRLMIDWTSTGPEPASALPYVQRLLARHPRSQSLMMAELRALDAGGEDELVGDRLRKMYDTFPESEQAADLLLGWYFSRNEMAEAEAFLRERAGADDAPFEGHATLVRLLRETQGDDVALEEIDRLATANEGTDLGRRYAAQAAYLRFTNGQDRDVSVMKGIVEAIQDEGQKNDGRMALVKMYTDLGDPDSATPLLTEILDTDPYYIDALLTRASRFIRAGELTDAVTDLRTVLSQAPRNVDAMLMLAETQQRLGNQQLAEQRLAQAVEVSDSSPKAAIPYAHFQAARGNLAAAERVLQDSVARNINNMPLVSQLAKLQFQRGDLDGARALLNRLVDSKNPEASELIRNLQANILFQENRVDDSLAFLRNSLDENGEGVDELGGELQILRIEVMSGRYEDASKHLKELQDRFPETIALKVIEANLLSLQGKMGEAIELLKALSAAEPDQIVVIQRLYALLQQDGRKEEAQALLSSALERKPDSEQLVLLRAFELEQEGDIDAALASYEKLYVLNPNNLTVANNYASMLVYYKDDEASLAKAAEIANVLSASNFPAILDTVGYVRLRQGRVSEAVLNLEAAARGLPDNPTVAFNLAEAYTAANRKDEAMAEYERGFRLAEGGQNVQKLDMAKAKYDMLAAEASQ
ncbi:tetratricopeptide repeat protein [Celeribacter neptunius]|uniref:tetratricopeptide repeat protein n=1 Tax=Celeribacter neptunius TaxID=588602 RepID=UPI0015A6701C|nr:tetratricopeptide repeat protein [Celeribacter neptunius]